MSETRRPTAGTARRAVALAIGALVAVLLRVTTAVAGPTTATAVRFDRLSTPGVTLPGTPGATGLWYVVQDRALRAELSFVANNVLAPALHDQVHLRDRELRGRRVGLGRRALPRGHRRRGRPDRDRGPGDRRDPGRVGRHEAQGHHRDLAHVRRADPESDPVNTNARSVIGGQGGTTTECNATVEAPVCADLVPPTTGFTAGGLFSRGFCSTTDKCTDTYIQALVAFQADRSDPATLIMKCDKDRCGGGAIRKQNLVVTLVPGTSGVTADPCPAKGTVGPAPQKFARTTPDRARGTTPADNPPLPAVRRGCQGPLPLTWRAGSVGQQTGGQR